MALTDNIAGYWKFDENSGSSVADATGLGNTGTWSGTLGSQWTTGKINSGGNLNGTDNYVTVGTSSTFNFERTQAFTISAWVKLTASTLQVIFAKRTALSPNAGFHFLVSSGKLRLLIVSTLTGSNYIDRQTTATINDGNFHFAVVTYDGSSSVTGIIFYIDGQLAASTSNNNNLSASILTTASPAIGATGISDGPAQFFTGGIDEVSIWTRVLSFTEQNELNNGGSGIQYPFTGATSTSTTSSSSTSTSSTSSSTSSTSSSTSSTSSSTSSTSSSTSSTSSSSSSTSSTSSSTSSTSSSSSSTSSTSSSTSSTSSSSSSSTSSTSSSSSTSSTSSSSSTSSTSSSSSTSSTSSSSSTSSTSSSSSTSSTSSSSSTSHTTSSSSTSSTSSSSSTSSTSSTSSSSSTSSTSSSSTSTTQTGTTTSSSTSSTSTSTSTTLPYTRHPQIEVVTEEIRIDFRK